MSATVSDGPYRVAEMRSRDVRTRTTRWTVVDTRASGTVVERVTFGEATALCTTLNQRYRDWLMTTAQALANPTTPDA